MVTFRRSARRASRLPHRSRRADIRLSRSRSISPGWRRRHRRGAACCGTSTEAGESFILASDRLGRYAASDMIERLLAAEPTLGLRLRQLLERAYVDLADRRLERIDRAAAIGRDHEAIADQDRKGAAPRVVVPFLG